MGFQFSVALLLGVVFGVSTLLGADETAVEKLGQQIYADHCVHCHGTQGQGTEEHVDSLHGDLPVEDLAAYISETMPESDPEQCVGEDAKAVAQFVYDRFYSPAAVKNLSHARQELARLTVRQYQESVADLVGSFADTPWIPTERGLSANYFASRDWTKDRRLAEQVDSKIDFADGIPHFEVSGIYESLGDKPDQKLTNQEKMKKGFSVFWSGSVIAPETGDYEIVVESKNGFKLWINQMQDPLIDRWVRSDDVLEHKGSIFMLGGRAYPIKLQLFSYPDPPAQIQFFWKPPGGHRSVIPESALITNEVPSSLAVSSTFPADDASAGYERGVSVSQQWDEATTVGAIEVANYVSDNLWKLAKTKLSDKNREQKVKQFCRQFVERAFANPLNEEVFKFFVGQHFENQLPIQDQVKRVVILSLKSPRFLYPDVEVRTEGYEAARRIALVMWDSVPDEKLLSLAAKQKLSDSATVRDELHRMIVDPRAKTKLRQFFHYWLKTDKANDATKDKAIYPDFDEQLLTDLRQSLDLYLDEVAWNEASDFRQLFLADFLYTNQRLAKFYGLDASESGFSKVSVDPNERAGILTHPYLMTGLAYHKDSSPIHRGVFVARNLLGRSLKQPPDNVKPLTEEFDPEMTTRQRVEHQTKEVGCMNCHSVINPLGFSLENFDAVGRFRTQEKEKQIDVSAAYKTPAGELVPLGGARDLANFLAGDELAQRSFIAQLFHHYAKQSIDAYGEDCLDQLHEKFVASEFSIRQLIIEISQIVVLQ